MNKDAVRKRILDIGIVPVVRASSPAEARMATDALVAGGIGCVEITMTVPGAIDVIRELAGTIGERVLIGAGTVLDADTAARCVDAGAKFLVSPGLDLPTLKWATEHNIIIAAGALTPTEVIAAWKAGSDFVKVFPCANVGGAKYIKALRGPLPLVPLIPTGGVNLETAAEFLKAGAAALGVGGELVLADALKSKQPERITELARKFVDIVHNARTPTAAPATVR
jgi:2-dehydro-3-deoxyphosphogluconate aldolase/(4S)-4-hydroxy-2-oxoglutarate aldolase